jgi:homoserine/homoserine lactone efflux protein
MDYNLVLFALTVLVISLIPGMNVLFVISQSINGGLRSSATSILGIVTGNLIYLSISILGLGIVLLQFPDVFKVVKYAGVIFTVYSAWKLLKLGRQKSSAASDHHITGRGSRFIQGMFTIVSNPKAFIFWITILPGFVHSENNILFYLTLFGILAIVIDTLVLLGYGFLASKASPFIQKRSPQSQFLVSGLILLVVATWLLFS